MPRLVRAQVLQPYKDWVQSGGLARFAALHDVKPDFLHNISEYDDKPLLLFLLSDELKTVPGLEAVMSPPDPPPSASFTAMTYKCIDEMENGRSSDSSEDEDEEEADKKGEEQLQRGKKESGTAPEAFDQDKDVSRKT
jgi:hypothetical protein